jgi:phosphoglycerate dehydrogenase-like enzyme
MPPRFVHVALKLDPLTQTSVERQIVAAGWQPAFVADAAQLTAHLPEVEMLLVGKPPRIDWSRAVRLRLLHVAGAGVDPLFPAEGLRPEVVVSNSRGGQADAVRDHVLGLLLAFARDLPRALAQQRERRWQAFATRPLPGQTLCLVGLGEIGRRIAAAGAALGMRVVGVNRSGQAVPFVERVFPVAGIAEAISSANYTVLSLPFTSATKALFDAALLAVLPDHAVLINVARGGIIDESALEARLRAGKLRGAALDVFADEPLDRRSSLWTCPRMLITPHSAGYTPDYLEVVCGLFLDAADRVARGELPKTVVSREREY